MSRILFKYLRKGRPDGMRYKAVGFHRRRFENGEVLIIRDGIMSDGTVVNA